jgi:hypothetical protein
MERGDPAVCNVSFNREGKDEMIKASIDLQDLRRRLYVKAKAETTWRFWIPGFGRQQPRGRRRSRGGWRSERGLRCLCMTDDAIRHSRSSPLERPPHGAPRARRGIAREVQMTGAVLLLSATLAIATTSGLWSAFGAMLMR